MMDFVSGAQMIITDVTSDEGMYIIIHYYSFAPSLFPLAKQSTLK